MEIELGGLFMARLGRQLDVEVLVSHCDGEDWVRRGTVSSKALESIFITASINLDSSLYNCRNPMAE